MANGRDSKVRLVDPSISINISIVFLDDSKPLTDDCEDRRICDGCNSLCIPQIVNGVTSKGRQYTVLQYVYNSAFIKSRYLKSISNAVLRALQGGRYIDPLNALSQKKASVKPLRSKDINNKTNENMKKNRIRLTESQLHRVIKESVKRVLKESVEGDIWNASDEYSMHQNWPLSYYGYYGPEAPKNSSKEDENDYSWKSLNALNNLKKSNMKSRQEDEHVFDEFTPSRKDFMNGMYDNVLNSMFYERLKNDLDNKWKNTKDMEKVSKRADSRPLHRKGSLNRELDESIRRAIRKVLH